MNDVVPRGAMLPRVGKDVRILVGEAIHVEDLIKNAIDNEWSDRKLHAAIADRVGATLYSLKAELDGLPLEAVAPQGASTELALQEENLLPLSIYDTYSARQQRWKRRWEALGLSSLAQRMHHQSSSSESTREMQQVHGGQLSAASLRDFMDTLTEVSKAKAKHVQQRLAAAATSARKEKKPTPSSLPDLAV
jgi:hypothetical protein